ncbi:MAG TPA: S41 family peptidase [Gemmataceae bacterium]|nr:S41 family peptidase [Gemmataceae bacterium]
MKSRVWLLGAVALLATTFAGRAAADDAVAPPKSSGPYLVVVGVGDFLDKAIDARPSADADAQAVYDLLTNKDYSDIKPERAKLLLSKPDDKRKGEVATAAAINKAVAAAVAATGKDDLIIVAFFGRGASAGDKTVFFTPETTLKDRAKTAFLAADLEPEFKKLKGQRVMLMMDVDYKGFNPGTEKIAEPNLRDLITAMYGEDKEDNAVPGDRLLVVGNPPFQVPLKKGEMSLFTATLLDALKGKADEKPYNQGYESDGLVTAEELAKYLEKEIPNGARVIGKDTKEKELTPFFIGEQTSHFWVTRNPAETAKVRKNLDALAALTKDGKISEELGKEGHGLLFRMPKLKATQELRKHYQQLADGKMSAEDLVASRKKIKDAMTIAAADVRTYARKVNQAIDMVTARYIKELNPGDLTAAAIKGMFRRIDEPLPTDLEEALKKPKELTDDRRNELLRDARTRLGKREDLDDDKDVDVSILMMMLSLNDPYTVYYDKEAVRKAASQLRGRFPGVGIQIRRDSVRDGLLVVTPIKGSPAFEGGVQAGDIITGIRRTVGNQGEPLPEGAPKEFSTKGMKTEEAIGIITGKPGTPISIVVDRDGKEIQFNLKRNWVSVETVLGVKRQDNTDWTFMLDDDYKIGYIHLTQFTRATVDDLKKAIDGLKKAGMKGLVLDLRGNPGGFLTSAIDISSMFVGKQNVVTVKPRVGRERKHVGEDDGDKGYSIAVLINGTSASASEIVAAALQDHGRAVVVGDKSYGKGSVQDVLGFDSTGGEIKLTIARYYPPTGRNIDKLAADNDKTITDWGVKPDRGYEVKLSKEEQSDLAEFMRNLEVIPAKGAKPKEAKPFEDKQREKALEYLREQIKGTGAVRAKGNN